MDREKNKNIRLRAEKALPKRKLSRLEIKGLKINSLSSKTVNIQRSLEKSPVVSGPNIDVIK